MPIDICDIICFVCAAKCTSDCYDDICKNKKAKHRKCKKCRHNKEDMKSPEIQSMLDDDLKNS